MGGWAIALHGGAGVIPQWKMTTERREAYEAALRAILNIGVKALERNLSALDVVELVVKALEDDTLFNAGTGSVLSNKGTVEMESCIMEGKTMNSGAVSGLSTVLHPVSLARLVMEKSPHVYLAFQGAEEFARMQGVETVDMKHFITQENEDRLTSARKTNSIQLDFEDFPELPTPLTNGHGNGNGHVHANGNGYKENGGNGYAHVNGNGYKNDHGNGYAHAGRNGFKDNDGNGYIHADENGFKDKGGNGYVHADVKCYNGNGIHTLKAEFETVGCVAVDSNGNCAAATSTGGLVNKMCGRIGDTPIVGAGTYANHLCGVSATGRGEELIKATVAREVAAMMEYKEMSLTSAVDKVIYDRLPKNMGGLVAVSATGEIAMAYNTPGMFRASAHEGGPREVGI